MPSTEKLHGSRQCVVEESAKEDGDDCVGSARLRDRNLSDMEMPVVARKMEKLADMEIPGDPNERHQVELLAYGYISRRVISVRC
jgi:hypothetical protein